MLGTGMSRKMTKDAGRVLEDKGRQERGSGEKKRSVQEVKEEE